MTNALCYKQCLLTPNDRVRICVEKGETIIHVHGSLLRNKYIRLRVAIVSEEKRGQRGGRAHDKRETRRGLSTCRARTRFRLPVEKKISVQYR